MAKEKKNNLEKEFDELKSLLQRTQADFVNYRRRNEEEKAEFVRLAGADVIEQILPVMDNFQMAAKHVPENLRNDNWVKGIQAIEKQLEQILAANGLEKVETVGKEFDPNVHEAIGQVAEEKINNNEIVSEEAAGYMLNGKLLRPAKVIVNNKKE
jgi:molecular chaperone GrpE